MNIQNEHKKYPIKLELDPEEAIALVKLIGKLTPGFVTEKCGLDRDQEKLIYSLWSDLFDYVYHDEFSYYMHKD